MTSLSVIENKILVKYTINDAKWATGYEEISNMSIHDLEMLVKHFNMKLFYTPYKEIKGNRSNNVADLLVNYHSINKSFVVDIIKQRMGNMSDFTRNSQYFENILTTFPIYRFTKTLEATWNDDDDTRVVLGKIYNSKKMNNEQKQPPKVFYKKGVFRNLTKFLGKHLCQGLFFNKVAGLRLQFCEISKNTFFTDHVWTTASKCMAFQNGLTHFKNFVANATRDFPLRISPVNVTKSEGNCGFGHIY